MRHTVLCSPYWRAAPAPDAKGCYFDVVCVLCSMQPLLNNPGMQRAMEIYLGKQQDVLSRPSLMPQCRAALGVDSAGG
jgi:hypothetical protein